MFPTILHHAISISSSEDESTETQDTKSENMGNETGEGSQPNNDDLPNQTRENLNAISVKLPEFWPATPERWFLRVESQFSLRGITSEQTRFDHVMSTISQDVALKIYDAVVDPGDTPYTTLKAAILAAFTPSPGSLVRDILNDVEIGDRTPSQFYRHLANQAESSGLFQTELVQLLWIERLPPQLRAILKIGNFKDSVKDMLATADQVFEALRKDGAVHSISNADKQEAAPSVVDLLQKIQLEVNELKARFDKSRDSERRSRSSSRSRGRNRSRSHSRNENPKFCYYHNRFGQRAEKCKPPCSFKSQNEQNNDSSKN